MFEKEQKFRAEFIMDPDGSLEMIYGNKLYLSLFDPQDRDGKGLPDRELRLYRGYIEKHMGHRYSLRRKRIFPATGNLLWDESIVIYYPRLSVCGMPDRDLSSPCGETPSGDKQIFMIVRRNGRFCVEGDVKAPAENSMGFDRKRLSDEGVRRLLEYCISTGECTGVFGLLDENGRKEHYYELYPYSPTEGEPRIALIMSCVRHELMGAFPAAAEDVYDDHMIAFGKISMIDSTEVFFSELNGQMTDALQGGMITLEEICGSKIFRDCLEYDSSGTGVLVSCNKDRERFIMGVCPGERTRLRRDILVFLLHAAPEEMLSDQTVNALTYREQNILRLCAEGKSIREIGEMLNICESTAKSILSGIYKKINAHNRTEAVLKIYGLL